MSDAKTAMRDLKRGFARADRDALARAVTEDFEWHLHWHESADDEPTRASAGATRSPR